MQLLKAVIVKQQKVINELKAENEQLTTANNQLTKAQHASSTEIARLCDEAAENAARADVLQQHHHGQHQHTAYSASSNHAENHAPKHIVVDRRRGGNGGPSVIAGVSSAAASSGFSDSSAPAVGAAFPAESEASVSSPAPAEEVSPLAPRIPNNDNLRETGTARSRRHQQPPLPVTAAGSDKGRAEQSRGRIVRRTSVEEEEDPRCIARGAPCLSDALDKENEGGVEVGRRGRPSEQTALKGPGASSPGRRQPGGTSAGGTGERALQAAKKQGRSAKGLPAVAVTSLYENSRSAARMAWSMLKTKSAYHGSR